MNDERSSNEESLRELQFSKEQGFFDKSSLIGGLIAALFVAMLFLLFHLREDRIEILELNTTASRYIVAQVGFDFLDEEATIILQESAARDINNIYSISRKKIAEVQSSFENHLAKDADWRKDAPQSTFEEMYQAVDELAKRLSQIRFTDSRTLKKASKANLADQNYYVFNPGDISRETFIPLEIWNAEAEKMKEPYQKETIQLLFSYFEERTWKFEEDPASKKALQTLARQNVAPKFTHIEAGSRLIDQGDLVTTRHLAMQQAMKQALNERRNLWHSATLLGSLLAALLISYLSIAYFKFCFPSAYSSNRKLFLIFTICLLTICLAKLYESWMLSTTSSVTDYLRFPLFVPFATILTIALLSPAIATFVSCFLLLILTVTLAVERQNFLLINLVPTFIAILNDKALHRRKDVFIVSAKACAASIVTILSLHLYDQTLQTSLLTDTISCMLFMLLTAVLVVGLFPLLESTFKIMTDVTLTEYMDPNNELLRRLTIEAPGTYQHSVVVGSLAEMASMAISANGLFCRVACLYHDIGKIPMAQYFTENQQGGMNIHQLLTPKESAQVIIQHVSEGVAMARRAGLPERFIDIIKEHHGTTLVYYFYRKQLELVGGQKSLVDERLFRYAGPRPRSKEAAIIMIADSFEAASRCLDVVSEDSLYQLIDSLVKQKMESGQFDECSLTFEELCTVKKVMCKGLLATGHARIKYPTLTSEGSAQDA
ncbi:MAG: putative rane bound phosphohydrolase [Chlamydiales bacterium]|nr:putative rane bound phosphohydrolase [Chlamydiales bacterium]